MIRPLVFSSILARVVSLLVLGVLVTFLLRGAPLQAATDISVCASGCDHSSIQAAINAAAPGDTIVLAGEIFVETIVVDRDLTIRGASSAASIIDGAAAGTVIVVPAGVSVTLESLTVRNGRTSGNGGGILNQGTLWASDIVVSSNVAATPPSSAGGGIYSTGQLTLVDSTVAANESYSGGGGLYVSGLTATALIERTNLVENRVHDMTTDFRGGGGLHVASADVTVRDSRIVGNRTDFTGGGVTVRGSSADVQIIDTTIDANISRLGVGITLQTSARLTIRGSTISNNTGAAGTTSSGGGLRAGAPVTITNSTIFGNSATGSGGGILAESTVTLDSVTIAGNSSGFGGGIASFSAGTTLINNSIVFGNNATNFGHDCAGSLDGGTGLLIGDPADCTTAAVTDVLVADPLLGPLADNGGRTLTMLPATDSPAVDAGTTSLTVDQRGEPRPAGGGPDLGSVEVQQEAEDTVAPHWTDATLVATTVSSRSFSIAWSGASDDVAVTAYEISLDGTVVETVPAPTTTASIGGVAPATRYVVNVQAIDAAGNRSADGPTTAITTAPDLGGDHLLPRADDPSAIWQTQLPMGDIDAARRLGQIVIVASAGARDPVLTFVDVAIPANIDIDGDGVNDVQVTVDLAPGPGLIPALVMTIDRLLAPGPEDVQIVAIAPLPDELSTALGKASLVTGVGTAAVDGGTGGHLPETETITASIDVIDGLDHRLGLDFATHNPLNPLVFYIGSAEGDGRDLGATGASLLGLQTSPVPSLVQLAFATQLSGVADPEPAARAVMEWRAPTTEPDPDILFFYMESEGIPKGTAADYGTRVLVEDIDPETTVTLLLEPDNALEINIDHDDPSTFTVDRIDRIELQHAQNGLDVRAAIRDLPGPRLSIRLDDGTGDLVVSNLAFHFDLELEISRPGNSFFGDAFHNPVDWIFVSALDVRELTIGSGDGGGIAFAFTDGPADVVFVAADDPLNLRFPAEQDGEWPSGHPSQWPDEQRVVRVGLVDDAVGTTLAVHAADTRSFRVDFDAPSLGQKVGLESAHRVRLDVEAEIGPGPNAQVPTTLGCGAFLAPALTSFDISPPNQFSFLSGGGEALRCHAETGTRSVLASAAAFPAVAVIGFDIERTAGAISIIAEDELGDDDPLTFVRVTLTDVEIGLTGDEPLGAPAELLAFAADELPSAAITWAHERGQDLDLGIESTADEDRIQDLKFLLATKADFFTEPFTPSFSQLLPVLERTGARPVFLARDALSVHVWELSEITLLAAAVDELRSLAATATPNGETRLGVDIAAPRPLVVELVLPLGRHFLPHIAIEGWCDLAVPDGTSGFDSRLPDSVSLVTSNPSGFESLQCRQHVQLDAPLNVNVLLDAHGVPDGTTVFTDLAAGRIGIGARVSTIEDISVEVRDRSGEGLLAASPFAHPIGSLAMRADGVSSLDAEWQLAEGMLDVELTARTAAEAVQFRASTQTQPDLLSEPGDHHHLLITDEGVSKGVGDTDDEDDEAGDGEVHLTVVGLVSAHVRHGANLSPLPFVIELETAASGPLVVDALLDFDSPLAPSLSPGTIAQIEATGRIDALSTTASYATNLAQLHQVSGAAAGADLWAHVVIDDDNTDEDGDEDPALEIFAEAQDLPAFFGLNAWDFMTSDAGTQAAFVELSSSMPLLDLVLRDPRIDGVRGSGSQRVRVRAEQIPQRVDFLIDDQLTDGTGSIAIDGRLSGRLGQLLIESNSIDPTGHPHFNTPFAQITAQLTDVPPDIRVLIHSDDATGSVSGEFVFGDGPIPAIGPDADDRIGRVEVILERATRDLSEDRGLPLELYADELFTSLIRSDFVRSVDDAYWASAPGVRARLGLVEQGFSLQTARIGAQPAADGEGPVERTMAVDDYVLVSQTRWGASSPLIALQLSNIQSLTFSSLQPDSRVDLVRPQSAGSPPLYVAFERVQPPSYPVSKVKLKLDKADTDAPEVAKDYVERFYDGAPIAPFMINVLANDGENADPRTLRLVSPPAHGFVVGANVSGAQQLRYTPLNPHHVGWDRFVYEVCSAEGACAQARVDILIHELYVGGTYVRMQTVPANAAVVTEGHFDRICKLVFGDEVPVTCEDVAVIDRVGFSASSTPAGIDVYRGPRTLPPTSVVPAFKAHAVQAPTATVWHLTAPDSYLFRFKAEMSGPADVAGVYATAKGRTWFGARGNGDFELGGAGSGLIGKKLQGGQVADEFKGCDRFLGIDTCVKLFGIDFDGSIKRRLDGFFAYAPATETTALSQSNGAADVEYLPLVTLRARNMTSIKGGVELQLELVPLGPQVEGNLSIKATALKADLWFPGAEAARFAWTTLGPISLPSSYDFNTPIPVIFGPAFDPYN